MRKIYPLLAAVLLLPLAACTTTTNTTEVVDEPTSQKIESLTFNPDNYETKTLTLNDEEIVVRAYENIIYVANPVDTEREIMNIYVPEAYYNGEEIN